MSLIAHYRELYQYEKDSNQKMLKMLHSVPKRNRTDSRFQQAVSLAHHLAVCRDKWLDRMEHGGKKQLSFF